MHQACLDICSTEHVLCPLPAALCSGAQRAVYEAVLEVHQACLDICQPGATLRQLHHVSVRLLAEALAQVGVILFPLPQFLLLVWLCKHASAAPRVGAPAGRGACAGAVS